MKKTVIILGFLILGFITKAQNWAPLDTGYFDPSFNTLGLCADTANGLIIQTNGSIENVFQNGKWQYWYPTIFQSYSYDPIIRYKKKKNLILKFFYENNDNSKPRTAVIRFSNATDKDTVLVLVGEWLNSGYTYYHGNLVMVLWSIGGATTSYNCLAEFNDTIFKPIGKPTWGVTEQLPYTCAVYQNELYAAGSIDSGIAVLKSGIWKKVYPGFHGGNKSIVKMLVYNNRLYVIGGFWKFENANNPGNSIAAWNGSKWDDLGGGASNQFVAINGGFDDAVVCNNKLYLVGNFTNVSGIKAQRLVSWNDTSWCTICTDVNNCMGRLWSIECLRDTVYAYGSFPYQSGKNIGGIGKLLKMNFNDTCSGPFLQGIKSYSNSNGIKIYPNPTSNTLHIVTEQNEFENSEIEITNVLGQTVLKQLYSNTIDVSMLSQGIYNLKITTVNKQTCFSKFIKE